MPVKGGGLQGFEECLAALEIVGIKARQALRPALSELGSVGVKAARAAVPRDTGSLKKSLGKRVRVYNGGATVVLVVGPRKDAKPKDGQPAKKGKFSTLILKRGGKTFRRVTPANYAHLVEYGTRPHSLAAGDRMARPAKGKRAATQARQSAGGPAHPGTSPRPFIAPAAATIRAQAAALLSKRVAAEIRKITAKRVAIRGAR